MDTRPPIPFFMAYPMAVPDGGEQERVSDRDYIRHLYPREAKEYLITIIQVLDSMDFRESYFYDEYPDQVTLLRLADNIMRFIPGKNNISRENQKILIQILLYDELLRRRILNTNL